MWTETVVCSALLIVVVNSYTLSTEDGKNYYFSPDIQPIKLRKDEPVKFVSKSDYKDDDSGFSHGTHEKGQDGFHHIETFHKKDGNDFHHEKNEGYGESKRDGEYREVKPERYEVTEKQREKNNQKPQKYGFLKPEWVKKHAKKGKKPIDKKNFNGYETVVYHENDKGKSDHGYVTGKAFNPPAQSYEYNTSYEGDYDGQSAEAGMYIFIMIKK
jgi:hypothetical protein